MRVKQWKTLGEFSEEFLPCLYCSLSYASQCNMNVYHCMSGMEGESLASGGFPGKTLHLSDCIPLPCSELAETRESCSPFYRGGLCLNVPGSKFSLHLGILSKL